MKYTTPELVLLGSAPSLVRGGERGEGDNAMSETSFPDAGIALGLDD